ncbi:MAG: rhodanese-like domain-containing protein [Maribacter sp.]|nr:rhodanese-like domain-containing protein [Maribacter sp.]NND78414.1 rhodanese-like domain-containing protein [Maribacter sp.]NNK75251.1 rhodanese-like domain-containing protein [Maribacter sp.]
MNKYIFLPILLLFVVGCSQIKGKKITEVSQSELDTVVLVDVRTPKEFNAGHLENALNIDWYNDSFTKEFEKIDKNKTIYLYCRSGKRSADATNYLDSLGYKKVVNLEGGYLAWVEKNPN